MKKFVVLSLIQLFFTTVVLAQAQIGSFYGLKLGMSISEVRSALRSQGATLGEDKSNFISVKKPKLGDITFDWLWLSFKDSKLVEGEFSASDGRTVDDDWYDSALSVVSSTASTYKKFFNEMRLNYIAKYGNPKMENEEEIIWRKGENQISLSYNFYDGPSRVVSGLHDVMAKINIIYKTASTNTNY